MSLCICDGKGTWSIMDSTYFCSCQVGENLRHKEESKQRKLDRTRLAALKKELAALEEKINGKKG